MVGLKRRKRIALASLLVVGGLLVDVAVEPVAGAAHGVADVVALGNQPRIMDGRVYAIVAYGTSVYVGGTFRTIRPASATAAHIRQRYLFKFDVDTGVIDPTFRPRLDGDVEGLALSADGTRLFVGGAFTDVNGRVRTRLVKLSTSTGGVDADFKATASDRVKDLALRGDDLIVGGYFRYLDGKPRERLGAVHARSGAVIRRWNVPLTGPRDDRGAFLQELDVSPDGSWMVVGGNFKAAGGQARQQVALIVLGDNIASVANWSTDRFAPQCYPAYNSTYIRGIDISPDSRFFVVSTTGAHLNGTLCDSASRWEMPPTTVGGSLQPTWVTWTGTDTHWAVEITDEAVYVGGHQRWENSPELWDGKAPGRVARSGIAALDPTNGVPLSWNPGRDRGRGAEALLATDAHLFVGSDTTLFGGVNRQRLAVVPFSGATTNPPPQQVVLPVTWHVGLADGTLVALPYDGAAFGPISTVSGPAIDGENWAPVRDAFVQHGELVYFGAADAYSRRSFADGALGSPTNLSRTVGYLGDGNATRYNQPYHVGEVITASYAGGWLYYTLPSDSRLWVRGYSNESGIIGGHERIASQADWHGARATEIVGEWMYAAWSDGNLYRFHMQGRTVEPGTRVLVDDGSVTGIDWASVGAFFGTQADGAGFPPDSPITPPPPACPKSARWAAQYFPTDAPAGVPATTRCDVAISFNWGRAAPTGTGVDSNHFSVRWTRRYKLVEAAALQVTATRIDDGIRVTVDGASVVDAWRLKAGTHTGETPVLSPGRHTVVVEYFDRTGAARVKVAVAKAPTPVAADRTAPKTKVTAPTADSSIRAGRVSVAGTASDDIGVANVRLAVRDTVARLWLQADGTWASAFATRSAHLDSPDRRSSNWSLRVRLSTGRYFVEARARDSAGNVDATPATIPFTVR